MEAAGRLNIKLCLKLHYARETIFRLVDHFEAEKYFKKIEFFTLRAQLRLFGVTSLSFRLPTWIREIPKPKVRNFKISSKVETKLNFGNNFLWCCWLSFYRSYGEFNGVKGNLNSCLTFASFRHTFGTIFGLKFVLNSG